MEKESKDMVQGVYVTPDKDTPIRLEFKDNRLGISCGPKISINFPEIGELIQVNEKLVNNVKILMEDVYRKGYADALNWTLNKDKKQ